MEKIIVYLVAVLIPIIPLYVLFSNCLIVYYERNTGPELVVLYGQDKLKQDGYSYGVNYSGGAYTTYEFDNKYGFENIGVSFAFYKVIGSKEVDGNLRQKAPIISVQRFYPFFFSICLIILILGIYISLVRNTIKNFLIK